MWWCGRQYYRARGKGYRPASAGTVVGGGAVAAFVAVIVGDVLVVDSTWSGAAKYAVVLLTFPVPALVATALVAPLPRRLRRAGPRSSRFLTSPACRVLEGGLAVAAVAAGVGGIVGFWFFPADLWFIPADALRLLQFAGILWASRALLRFYRGRLDAPTLSDTVTADPRPAVLYLRAFRQESDAFVLGSNKELSRYTRQPTTITFTILVTFEQFLGAEFIRQLGPFVALGNPLDPLPPEGAARSYAPDEDWQRHFLTLATDAAAIVMDGSRSDNLHWELTEITRNGWQPRLFFLTAPAPRARAVVRLLYALVRSAKGVRIPRWEQLAAELERTGLHVPPTEPGPGSVLAFDAAGRAEVVVRGAQQPEEFVAAVRMRLVREGRGRPPARQ